MTIIMTEEFRTEEILRKALLAAYRAQDKLLKDKQVNPKKDSDKKR